MLLCTKDEYFPIVIKIDAPSNIQGVGNLDVTPMVLSLGGQYEGKRMKVNVEGAQAYNVINPQKTEEIEETKENRVDIDLGIARDRSGTT